MVDQAVAILKSLIDLDPQFIEAYQVLQQIITDDAKAQELATIVTYLTIQDKPAQELPEWLSPLWDARKAFAADNFDQATQLVHQSLVKSPDSALPAILHLKAAYKSQNAEMLKQSLRDIHPTMAKLPPGQCGQGAFRPEPGQRIRRRGTHALGSRPRQYRASHSALAGGKATASRTSGRMRWKSSSTCQSLRLWPTLWAGTNWVPVMAQKLN